jgi:hypothetical protein
MWDKKAGRHAHLASWEREVEDGVGDADSTAVLGALLVAEGKGAAGKGAAGKGSAIALSESKREKEFADKLWELRELVRTQGCCVRRPPGVLCGAVRSVWHGNVVAPSSPAAVASQMHELRALHKEHVGRRRSLRFFERVRDFQSAKPTDTLEAFTPTGLARVRVADAAVLSCCGHVGAASWLHALAERQECAAPGCAAAVRDTSIVRAAELHGQSESVGGSFGCKLSAVVDKVLALPKTERVLIFVQFPDLMAKVGARRWPIHRVDTLWAYRSCSPSRYCVALAAEATYRGGSALLWAAGRRSSAHKRSSRSAHKGLDASDDQCDGQVPTRGDWCG